MSTLQHTVPEAMTTQARPAAPRWQEMYTIGGLASIVLAIIPVVAVIAFFIWPYAPGVKTTAEIFDMVQAEPFGALMALDFFVLLGGLVSILLLLPLYIALKDVNESYAMIALVTGLLSVGAIVAGRPIAEVFVLSDQYAAATNELERSTVLAAGEALIPAFHGTAWMVYAAGMSISYLLSAWLMLRSDLFDRATAWVGVVTNVLIGGFFLPVIGPFLMFLGTITGVVWSIQLARAFFRLANRQVAA